MTELSIIIPVYKVEKYIERCLQSVADQESCGVSIECLLIDDCSPDCSIVIAKNFIENYHGSIIFKVIRHDINQGLSAARNTGIRAAEGNWIFFMDSDDWLSNNAIARLLEAKKLAPDIDLVMGNYFSIKDNSPFPLNLEHDTLIDSKKLRCMMLNYQINSTAWNKLLHRQFILQKGLFFEEGIIFEDTNWSWQLFAQIETAIVVPEITYTYENDNPQSIINTIEDKATLAVKSIIQIGRTILAEPYNDLYVDSTLYLTTFFVKAMELCRKGSVEGPVKQSLFNLRGKLLMRLFQDIRLVLSFYFLMMTYPPMSGITRFSFFRRHYDKTEQFVRTFAKVFDKIHFNNQRNS